MCCTQRCVYTLRHFAFNKTCYNSVIVYQVVTCYMGRINTLRYKYDHKVKSTLSETQDVQFGLVLLKYFSLLSVSHVALDVHVW